jgi:hypothetical protein
MSAFLEPSAIHTLSSFTVPVVAADGAQQLAVMQSPVLALQLRDDWLAPSRSLA